MVTASDVDLSVHCNADWRRRCSRRSRRQCVGMVPAGAHRNNFYNKENKKNKTENTLLEHTVVGLFLMKINVGKQSNL